MHKSLDTESRVESCRSASSRFRLFEHITGRKERGEEKDKEESISVLEAKDMIQDNDLLQSLNDWVSVGCDE
jgi:hypothetical protein